MKAIQTASGVTHKVAYRRRGVSLKPVPACGANAGGRYASVVDSDKITCSKCGKSE